MKKRRSSQRLDPYRNYKKASYRRSIKPARVVNYPNANQRLRWLSPKPAASFLNLPLIEIEDRRQWTPTSPYGARTTTGRSNYSLAPVSSPFSQTAYSVGFEAPRKTLICIRRKQRREVLLAKGRGGANRKPKRNMYSDVRC